MTSQASRLLRLLKVAARGWSRRGLPVSRTRSRKEPCMSRRNLAVLGAAAVAAAAVAAPVLAQSSGGQTITFRELDKGSRFAYIDNPPRNSHKGRPVFSVGD